MTLVVLHGASGPEASRTLAKEFSGRGYTVLYPHYFDAAKGTARTDADFAAWVNATRECIAQKAPAGQPVVLFGLSLGASIALAAGTDLPNIDSVIDWAGSLPDGYFERLHRLPPLLILHGDQDTNVPVVNAQQLFRLCERLGTKCEGTIYRGEGHMFPGEFKDAMARTLAFLQSRVNPAASQPVPLP